ncbi:matrix metallo ase-11 [Trichoderma cornu-damae]|uniref:Matrix metallo ase-11 n=1 Tax=Trichoderma cornu-damae TaxID=654480 RepID=A0A9P8TUV2_9HYPO|nr:matrix metallo ase-11 [Trichoderma cornu-damae]
MLRPGSPSAGTPMAEQVLATSTTIPRDTSSPWSPLDCRVTVTGDGGHGASLCESGGSSSEGATSASASADDTGDASTDATGVTDADAGDDEVKGRRCVARLEAVPNLVWPCAPAHGQTLLRYGPVLKIEDDGQQAGDGNPTPGPGPGDDAMPAEPPIPLIPGSSDRGRTTRYRCAFVTQGCDEARVGLGDHVPRWRENVELKYIVRDESFPTASAAALVAAAAAKAISMWQGIGPRFTQVRRDEPASFEIKYKHSPKYKNSDSTYARAFFPQACPSNLLVYRRALDNADFLANILAHEFGHILGLRHGFVEASCLSVQFGNRGTQSVMNYYDKPSKHLVGEWDLEDLRMFYAYRKEKIDELPIIDVEPQLYTFNRDGTITEH